MRCLSAAVRALQQGELAPVAASLEELAVIVDTVVERLCNAGIPCRKHLEFLLKHQSVLQEISVTPKFRALFTKLTDVLDAKAKELEQSEHSFVEAEESGEADRVEAEAHCQMTLRHRMLAIFDEKLEALDDRNPLTVDLGHLVEESIRWQETAAVERETCRASYANLLARSKKEATTLDACARAHKELVDASLTRLEQNQLELRDQWAVIRAALSTINRLCTDRAEELTQLTSAITKQREFEVCTANIQDATNALRCDLEKWITAADVELESWAKLHEFTCLMANTIKEWGTQATAELQTQTMELSEQFAAVHQQCYRQAYYYQLRKESRIADLQQRRADILAQRCQAVKTFAGKAVTRALTEQLVDIDDEVAEHRNGLDRAQAVIAAINSLGSKPKRLGFAESDERHPRWALEEEFQQVRLFEAQRELQKQEAKVAEARARVAAIRDPRLLDFKDCASIVSLSIEPSVYGGSVHGDSHRPESLD
eukprot:TRINITY_DN9893_c0_g1_i1.p1 TRINITY_DN9893_c0_g1~~TRINITY_DN9893_c0_g1_i1.p1  ORF type:complete len:486 (+),score=73.36 TRINITY_DN9893_c0_g1_i1:1-1458(+)